MPGQRPSRGATCRVFGGLFLIALFFGSDLPHGSRVSVEQIPIGTAVGHRPPSGWSHLIIKSVPHLDSGDTATLPEFAGQTASLFRTVLLADIRRLTERDGQIAFRLVRLGRALCVPHDGRDVVVASDRKSPTRETLGIVELQVLRAAEAEIARGKVIAASDQVTVYSTPVRLCRDGGHIEVELTYALCVNPKTGALKTLVWARPDGDDLPMELAVVVVESGLVYKCSVDVKAIRLLGTVPWRWEFAMKDLPPGKRLSLSTQPLRRLTSHSQPIALAEQILSRLEPTAVGHPD